MRWAWAVLAIITVAVVLRVYALGRLPGINGDEAWYGIAALEFASGGRFGLVTPNGNPLGPLQFAELYLLHLLFDPAPVLLRIPSLLSSLGAIALAGLAARRIGGREMGWLAAAMLAVLPINIAYARLGWDPSHSGLLVLLATSLLLGGSRAGSALVFAASLWVHPTNLFAAPFLLMIRIGQLAEGNEARKPIEAGVYFMMLALGIVLFVLGRAGDSLEVRPAELLARLVDPAQYAAFARLFAELLTGETVYRYVTGHGMGWLANPTTILTLLVIGAMLISRIRVRRFGIAEGVQAGWLASLAAFYLLAGPEALQPHFERYGFVLVAPTALALATMIGPWLGNRWTKPALAVTGVALLAGFVAYFLVPLERGAQGAPAAFWTGSSEPKAAAAQQIITASKSGPVDLVPEDFWLYMPARYLLHGAHVRLHWRGSRGNSLPAGQEARSHWLVYQGSALDRHLASANRHRILWVSEGPANQRLRIWRPS